MANYLENSGHEDIILPSRAEICNEINLGLTEDEETLFERQKFDFLTFFPLICDGCYLDDKVATTLNRIFEDSFPLYTGWKRSFCVILHDFFNIF